MDKARHIHTSLPAEVTLKCARVSRLTLKLHTFVLSASTFLVEARELEIFTSIVWIHGNNPSPHLLQSTLAITDGKNLAPIARVVWLARDPGLKMALAPARVFNLSSHVCPEMQTH